MDDEPLTHRSLPGLAALQWSCELAYSNLISKFNPMENLDEEMIFLI